MPCLRSPKGWTFLDAEDLMEHFSAENLTLWNDDMGSSSLLGSDTQRPGTPYERSRTTSWPTWV